MAITNKTLTLGVAGNASSGTKVNVNIAHQNGDYQINGKSIGRVVGVTQADYNTNKTTYEASNNIYVVTDAADFAATEITYDNSSSGLAASTVQAAIDELNGNLGNYIKKDTSEFNIANIKNGRIVLASATGLYLPTSANYNINNTAYIYLNDNGDVAIREYDKSNNDLVHYWAFKNRKIEFDGSVIVNYGRAPGAYSDFTITNSYGTFTGTLNVSGCVTTLNGLFKPSTAISSSSGALTFPQKILTDMSTSSWTAIAPKHILTGITMDINHYFILEPHENGPTITFKGAYTSGAYYYINVVFANSRC